MALLLLSLARISSSGLLVVVLGHDASSAAYHFVVINWGTSFNDRAVDNIIIILINAHDFVGIHLGTFFRCLLLSTKNGFEQSRR